MLAVIVPRLDLQSSTLVWPHSVQQLFEAGTRKSWTQGRSQQKYCFVPFFPSSRSLQIRSELPSPSILTRFARLRNWLGLEVIPCGEGKPHRQDPGNVLDLVLSPGFAEPRKEAVQGNVRGCWNWNWTKAEHFPGAGEVEELWSLDVCGLG